ncbi:MAG: hypothetical protein IJF02_03395, partial [Oscillospiraceae bacterium]|nr:hypothetical protein [Oscillospiraceae bacterium]
FLSGSSDPLTCHALFAEKEHPKQFPVLDALVSFNLPLGLVTNLMTLGKTGGLTLINQNNENA